MRAAVEEVTLAHSVITELDSLAGRITARRMRGLSDTPLQIDVDRQRYIEPSRDVPMSWSSMARIWACADILSVRGRPGPAESRRLPAAYKA